MSKHLLLFILLLFCKSSFSQTTKTVEFAERELQSGKHKVAIITYEFPEEIRELQKRAIDNLSANHEWRDKYIVKEVELGTKTLRFMDAYGLTQTEFLKMLNGFKNEKRVVSVDTANLNIQRINEIISFKGDSKLTAFNYLTIDTKKSHVIYDNYNLTKEVELTGQKFYAPILFGYESFWSVDIPGKKSQTNLSTRFSIGVNSGDNKPTLCLIMQSSISEVKYLIITIL